MAKKKVKGQESALQQAVEIINRLYEQLDAVLEEYDDGGVDQETMRASRLLLDTIGPKVDALDKSAKLEQAVEESVDRYFGGERRGARPKPGGGTARRGWGGGRFRTR